MVSKKMQENIVLFGISVIAVVSVVTTTFLVDKSLKAGLVTRANTIASLLSTMPLSSLHEDGSDLTNVDYQSIKNKLKELHRINKDSRFLYIVKATDKGIIFLVDSEETDSPDYSPPGQIYEEVTPHFKTATIQGVSGWEISGDRWGAWMTGYAPIYDKDTGQYYALVGIDLDFYRNYLVPIVGYSLIPLFIFIIILIILFHWRKLEEIEEQIVAEKDQLIRIAHHEFGTPVAESGWACEKLLANKAVQNDKEALTLTRQVYASLNTLVRRTTNLLKTIELTVPEPLPQEKLDIVPLLMDAVNIHKKVAQAKEKNIQLQQLPEHAFIKGNASALQTVFANLIAHSLYYSKDKSTVEITYKDTGSYYEISTLSSGDTLKEHEAESLFSAYYKGEKLSSHTESTGLGLYLIHKIVTRHRGNVGASANEKGVTLCIALPKID